MKTLDRYEILEFAPADYFQPARLADIFPDRPDAPAELDLGCGDGGFLLAMAAGQPNHNFLGVERLLGRVRGSARRALRDRRTNVRFLRLDTNYAVHWLLPESSFARIHLLFPDPWPKKRHHRRRIVQTGFLKAIHRLLPSGGEFLFKTDDPDYFRHAQTVAASVDFLETLPWHPDEFIYPETDFERLWRAKNRDIHRLRMRRID